MERQDLDFIAATFDAFVSQTQANLRRGLKRRDNIKKQIAANALQDNYRTQWLRASAATIVQNVKELALQFNATYDDDQASALDLIDILNTATALLKDNAASVGEAADEAEGKL